MFVNSGISWPFLVSHFWGQNKESLGKFVISQIYFFLGWNFIQSQQIQNLITSPKTCTLIPVRSSKLHTSNNFSILITYLSDNTGYLREKCLMTLRRVINPQGDTFLGKFRWGCATKGLQTQILYKPKSVHFATLFKKRDPFPNPD